MIKKFRYKNIRCLIPTAWTPYMLKSMRVNGETKYTEYLKNLVKKDIKK